MIEGIIIRGVGGNYYVDIGSEIIECRARGLFRVQNIKPLVGDKVLIRPTTDNKNDKSGYIEEIKERINEIKRPSVANVEQLLIFFAVSNPEPSFLLLDKLLIAAEINKLKPIICFNKSDLCSCERKKQLMDIYVNTGYKIIFTSKNDKESIETLKGVLKNKLSVFSGPSGVGKSSIMNAVQPDFELKTGEISEKLKRGKHTTRHAELFELSFDKSECSWRSRGYVVDTPGFSSLELAELEPEELQFYYPELGKYIGECKFRSCSHIAEPGCRIKEMVSSNDIDYGRYQRYVQLYNILKK